MTRNQLKEKNCKKHKYIEDQQLNNQKDHWRNPKKKSKISRDKIQKWKHNNQVYGMQQKQFKNGML